MNEKPTLSPELIKSIATLVGAIAAIVGGMAGSFTWHKFLFALGPALIAWINTSPLDLGWMKIIRQMTDEQKQAVTESVNPPAPTPTTTDGTPKP